MRTGASALAGRFRLENARRPQHADDVGGASCAETEHHIRRRDGGRRGRYVQFLPEAARADLDGRAKAAAIAHARCEAHADRTVPMPAFVPPDPEIAVREADDGVGVAIPVEIAEGDRLK